MRANLLENVVSDLEAVQPRLERLMIVGRNENGSLCLAETPEHAEEARLYNRAVMYAEGMLQRVSPFLE